MKIDDMMLSYGADVFYTSEFRNVLEDHVTYLKNHPQTYIETVTSAMAYKFEGDLFGLLTATGHQSQLHWIIMRMNDMTSPVYTQETLSSLKIPSDEVISRIRSVYMNVNKIKN